MREYNRVLDKRRVDELDRLRFALQTQICRELRVTSLYEHIRGNLREALAQVEHAIEAYLVQE